MIHGAICGQIMRDNNPRIAIMACVQQSFGVSAWELLEGIEATPGQAVHPNPLLRVDSADLMRRHSAHMESHHLKPVKLSLTNGRRVLPTQSRKESQATGLRAEHRKPAGPKESTHPLPAKLDE